MNFSKTKCSLQSRLAVVVRDKLKVQNLPSQFHSIVWVFVLVTVYQRVLIGKENQESALSTRTLSFSALKDTENSSSKAISVFA